MVQLQEIANDKEQKDSIKLYMNVDSYMSSLLKAAEDPSITLVNSNFIQSVLANTILDNVGKTQAIIKHDLNKVIKLQYAEFQPDEKNTNRFWMHLRDKCAGDFSLLVNYVHYENKWKVDKLLLYEAK